MSVGGMSVGDTSVGGNSIVSVRDVTLRFGGVTALDGVSFEVEAGSIHALIGPNGAGKSSCFNLLSGVYRPTSGSVHYDGHDITGRAPHHIASLGVARAFQNLAQAAGQTVLESLMVARHHLTRSGFLATALGLPHTRREERRHRARVREIAGFLALTGKLDRPTGALSYGDRKRIEIARALAMEPSLILLDEPVAGMNHHETAAIGALIRQIPVALGTTVLVVEHDMELIMQLADRITVLDFGRVIADGPPAAVREHPDVIRAYLGMGTPNESEPA